MRVKLPSILRRQGLAQVAACLPRAGHALLDLLLPDQCRLCGASSPGCGYCGTCAAGLPRHDRQCPACGVPLSAAGLCGRCQREPPPFTETIAPFRYAPPVSEDIHGLKYQRKLACGRDLGTLLARELQARLVELPDVLVPVPLHWKRRFRRGFNQSLEIALPVSSALEVPIDARLIERALPTTPQVGLDPARRRRNLRHAFRTSGRPLPERVALVDDVVTSGSTVTEAARCLRAGGTRTVFVWAVCRV